MMPSAQSRALVARILLILTLSVLSLIYQQADWRYGGVAGEILQNADFSKSNKFWQVAPGGDVVIDAILHGAVLRRDRVEDALPYILQGISDFGSHEHLRIGAEIRLEDLHPGRQPWQRAVLNLDSFSAARAKMNYWPHEIANLSGANGWQTVNRVLPVPKSAKSMRLVAFMGAPQGRMAIRNISVRAVRETTLSRWLGQALLAGWLLAGAWCLAPLLRRPLITPARAMMLVAGLAVLAGALAPQPQLGQAVTQARQLSDTALKAIRAAALPDKGAEVAVTGPQTGVGGKAVKITRGRPASVGKPHGKAGKTIAPPRPAAPLGLAQEHLGHLAAYLILSALALAVYGRRALAQVVTGLCLFAIASEALQSFVVTRDAEWADLAYNGLGIVTGCAFAMIAHALFSRFLGRRKAAG